MVTITYLSALAAIWKLVDLVKYVTRSNLRETITQLLVFAAAIGGAFLMGAADVAKGWDVGAGVPLTDMDGWSKVLLGVVWAGGASAAYDIKKALDSSDSAAVPSLPIVNRGEATPPPNP
jgi:hypothetical protein